MIFPLLTGMILRAGYPCFVHSQDHRSLVSSGRFHHDQLESQDFHFLDQTGDPFFIIAYLTGLRLPQHGDIQLLLGDIDPYELSATSALLT